VNIGVASPNSGASSATLDFPQGLVLDPPGIPASANRGLVYEYAAQGLPVINLLNVPPSGGKKRAAVRPRAASEGGGGRCVPDVRYNKGLILLP
jgi:hypothetical protein